MPEILTPHTETKARTKSEKELYLKELSTKHNFYRVKVKDGEFQSIEFSKPRILKLLNKLNFYRFDIDTETFRHVLIKDNRVKEVSIEYIKDTFQKYIKELDPYEHSDNLLITSAQLYDKWIEYHEKITLSFLNRLNTFSIERIKKDTNNEKFLYFKNCVVAISLNEFKTLDYSDIDGFIWENQVLNRDFVINDTKGDFEQFVFNISDKDEQRFLAIQTISGYILHQFYKGKLFAIALTDSQISEFEEANGRTGKGLFAESFGYMLNANEQSRVFTEIDGKKMKDQGKFVFENCSMETQILHINDVYRGAKLEDMYNDILKGITVDQKNKKPFKIFVKIIISTNLTLHIDGDSDKDRVKVFEFSEYYSAKRSPYTEFGKWFFSDDWQTTEWNKFDTFFIKCIQQYFKFGLIDARTINLEERTLIDHTSRYFVDMMDEFFTTNSMVIYRSDIIEPQILLFEYGKKIDKKDLFDTYLHFYKSYHRYPPTQHTFTKWLKQYSESKKDIQKFSRKKNTEGQSGGSHYIIFKKITENENE